MRKLILLFIFTLIYACGEKEKAEKEIVVVQQEKVINTSKASSCPAALLYGMNNLEGFTMYVNEIERTGFDRNNKEDFIKWETITNSDSMEILLQKRFPDIFKKQDGGYLFKTKLSAREIEVKNNITQGKSASEYRFVGQHNELVLLHQQYYEGQDYLVINTNSSAVHSFGFRPRFMTENQLYSIGDNYGYIDFELADIKEGRFASLSFENFILRENHSAYGNTVYVKLEHHPNFNNFSYFTFLFKNR